MSNELHSEMLNQAEKMNIDSLNHLSSAKKDLKRAYFIAGLATIITMANALFVLGMVLS